MVGFAVLGTTIGPVGVLWTSRGLARVALPDRDEERTRRHLLRSHPKAAAAEPPPSLRPVLAGIGRLLRGEPVFFDEPVIDWDGVPDFNRAIYRVALGIPAGDTLTYGEVARRIGAPGAARAVGAALGRNPVPIVVPCHRVLAAGGRPGGFSAPGGAATKLRLLAIEGAAIGGQPDLFSGRAPAPPGLRGGDRRPPRSARPSSPAG